MAKRDKIFDVHFVQFLFYNAFLTVSNGYVPVICRVVHPVLSGQLELHLQNYENLPDESNMICDYAMG
jgi:hypothetical protein